MWIVRLALRRPYTFVVVALLIAILGVTAIVSMPVDIFPYIDIPVVSVVWSYQGLTPEEMEKRVVTFFERSMTTTVNDIEHIESQSYSGVSVIRVYFQPNAKVEMALAQITAQSQTLLRIFPPGMTPPSVIKYDASSVPILQLGLESKTLSEQELFDLGQNFIRTQLATIQGCSVPLPYGGKSRMVMVDLMPEQLYAKGLSPADVSAALGNQNLILPAGTVKIGATEYQVRLNSSPRVLDDMNNLPLKVVNGATVYVKDVAQVRDGYAVQTSIVRTNGTRGALLTVMRNGKASTLAVVNNVKKTLPGILAGLTSALQVRQFFDQSLFVRAAINGVVREAIMAACLTGLMILMFLGSWRSTVIVCISIPLSILVSLIVLSLMGQTINVMTLGGLALAVGILVDDATVEIENTHRNMAMKKPLVRAVLDGAQQIAAPAFVSTLSICIVFVPVLLLTGAARYLFTPHGHGRGVRHDGVLLPVANPDPHHGALHAAARVETVRAGRRRRDGRRHGDHLGVPLHFQPALPGDAGVLHVAAALVAGPPRPGPDRVRGVRGGVAGTGGIRRPRLLPRGGLRADAPARAGSGGDAYRADRRDLQRHRA